MALGALQYKSKGDARQKIKIELLRPRETDVGVVQSLADRLKKTILKQTSRHIFHISLYTALRDPWMGKYCNFSSQTPKVRPKSASYHYTPKRDDEHPLHFLYGSPPPLPGGRPKLKMTQSLT